VLLYSTFTKRFHEIDSRWKKVPHCTQTQHDQTTLNQCDWFLQVVDEQGLPSVWRKLLLSEGVRRSLQQRAPQRAICATRIIDILSIRFLDNASFKCNA
jgi:hypothetical protein